LPLTGELGDGSYADSFDGVWQISDVWVQSVLSVISGSRMVVDCWKMTGTAGGQQHHGRRAT